MAKGRKHGLLHHERLLGSFRYAHGHPASAADLPDLVEADVWSATAPEDDTADGEPGGEDAWYGDSAWRPPAAAHDRRNVGGLSLAFDGSGGGTPPPRVVHQYRNAEGSAAWGASESRRHHHAAASAPVTVPGWPGAHRGGAVVSPPGDGEFDSGGEWVPPHEYLAREYAAAGGARAAAGSVFEGVGRTLKGRDQRRLRDAVWSQTGFYG